MWKIATEIQKKSTENSKFFSSLAIFFNASIKIF